MLHADPWDEIPRLEALLEAELLTGIESTALWTAAEHFCTDGCRVDGRCPIAHAIRSRDACPLWTFVRSRALQA